MPSVTLEVSHEALIREWQRLGDWLRDAREDLRLQKTLAADVAEWKRQGQPDDMLYRGTVLEAARDWAQRETPSRDELLFINIAHDMQEKNLQHLLSLEAKSRQRLLSLVFVLASAVVIALILTGFALRQTSNARTAQSTSDSNAAAALTAEGLAMEAADAVSTQAAIAQENADEAARQADEARRLALAAVAQEALLLGESDTALAIAMEAVHAEERLNVIPELAVTTLLQVAHAPSLIYEEQVLNRPIEHIAISPDGKYALLAVGRNQASYWGFGLSPPSGSPPPGGRPPRPNVETFAIVVWDIEGRDVLMSLIGHRADPTDIVFLPPTEDEPYRPVSASSDGTLIFWNWESGQVREVLEGLHSGYLTLSLTENGRTLLVASGAIVAPREEQRPAQMVLVDIEMNTVIQRIDEQHENLLLARITPDGRYIVSLHLDGTHLVWDIEDEIMQSRFDISSEIIRHISVDIAINPNSLTVATNTGGTDVVLWEVETGDRIGVARAATTLSHRIDFNADGSLLLMMSRDARLSIWEAGDNYLVDALSIGNDVTISLAMSPDDKTALFGTRDGILRVYAVISQLEGLITTYDNEGFATSGTVFQDEETTFLLSRHPNHPLDGGNWLILWNVATGERVSRFAGNLRSLFSSLELSISPDGVYIMGVSSTGLQLWDIATGQEQNCFFCGERSAGEASIETAFIPSSGLNDSSLQVVVEQDNALYLWNMENDENGILLEAVEGEVTELDVSSDGSTVLVVINPVLDDESTLLWLDIETGNIIHSVELDSNPTAVAFVPDSLSAAVAMSLSIERNEDEEEEFEGGENTLINDAIACRHL